MNIKFKRFDKELPVPEYQTKGAVAFDLYARETTKIKAGEIGYVPLNIAVKPPKDHFFVVAARSSTHKKGVMMINGIGVGDLDFCGDGDEYKAPLFNFTKKPVTIERGDRIVQGMFVKFAKVGLNEVEKMSAKTRGGFGSTGEK